ncbi:MAG TPA: O-antigen ligase family protein, partial [Longimicrobiales bacterium]|nr:O-antigen ligase family protein [Longimicrobiales bacterium]
MILRTRYRVRGLLVAGVVAAAVWVLIPAEQMERLRAMGEDETSVRRLDMWEDGIRIANENPVLGIGYDNWEGYYRAYHGGGLPHNIFIQAWAELGYVGLAAFLTLILGTFWVNWGSRRIARTLGERGRFIYFMAHGLDGALIGLLASGFFVTVLHYPFVWINLAMTVSLRVAAGHTARAVARARRAGEGATRPRPAPALAGPGVVPAAPTPR